MLAAVNATPCWDLNIASLTAAEIEDTVRVLRGTAARAALIELGNELYSGHGQPTRPYGKEFPAVSDYLQRVTPAVAAMRAAPAASPQSNWAVPLAPAPLLSGKRDPGNDETDWNDGMIANASIISDESGAYDAVTVHLYLPSENTSWLDCLARHPEQLWPSVLGAFPDMAIARTINSTRSQGLKGSPQGHQAIPTTR